MIDLGSYHIVGAWYSVRPEPFTVEVWRSLREVLEERFGMKGSQCTIRARREVGNRKPIKLGTPSLKPDGLDRWLVPADPEHPGCFAEAEMYFPKWTRKSAVTPMVFLRMSSSERLADGALVEEPTLILAAEQRSSKNPLADAVTAVAATRPSGMAYMSRPWGYPQSVEHEGRTVYGYYDALESTYFSPDSLREKTRGWSDLPSGVR